MKTARALIQWLLAPLIALLGLLGTLYEQHKFARRFTLHWSQALITLNVLAFWNYIYLTRPVLSDGQMLFLGGITALLGISIGLYQWDAARESK